MCVRIYGNGNIIQLRIVYTNMHKRIPHMRIAVAGNRAAIYNMALLAFNLRVF